jgi:hypothetical protein
MKGRIIKVSVYRVNNHKLKPRYEVGDLLYVSGQKLKKQDYCLMQSNAGDFYIRKFSRVTPKEKKRMRSIKKIVGTGIALGVTTMKMCTVLSFLALAACSSTAANIQSQAPFYQEPFSASPSNLTACLSEKIDHIDDGFGEGQFQQSIRPGKNGQQKIVLTVATHGDAFVILIDGKKKAVSIHRTPSTLIFVNDVQQQLSDAARSCSR